jgi:uncharacterized membrane protein YphA (DoxX/SURF4 family)
MNAQIKQLNAILSTIPYSVTAFIARFSIAATFWKSGQTKIEGFVLDIVSGDFMPALPHLGASIPSLFRDEYKLPFVDPTLAASLAAFAEHLFPALILVGFATRLSSVITRHDADHSIARLSGGLRNSRCLGCSFTYADRQRWRSIFYRLHP